MSPNPPDWDSTLPPALLARLRRTLSGLRQRRWVGDALTALPIIAGLAVAFGLRLGAAAAAVVVLLGGVVAGIVIARRLRDFGPARLLAQLDRAHPEFEDSVLLALGPGAPPNAVAALQRARMRTRIEAGDWRELREPWPTRRWWLAALIGVLIAATVAIPSLRGVATPKNDTPPARAGTATAGQAELRLRVEPPAYTGLAAFGADTGNARVPAGSRVRFSLGLDAPAQTVSLRFHDDSRLDLQRDGDRWMGERVVDTPVLVRVEADEQALEGQRWRIDVLPDQAPVIRFTAPSRTLSEADAETAQWSLAFEVEDDYGLGAVRLELTHTHGTGEQIEVSETTREVEGQGDPKLRRYSVDLTMADFGFAEGDDLIARVVAHDQRAPEPNEARSAGYILRWAPEPFVPGDVDIEGVVRDTLPAYFRSQRQIIIDTEQLIADRPDLSDGDFADRSDRIGEDQKLLRLRYGQFMGEEAEGADLADEHGAEAGGHDEGGAASFGEADNVLAEFGHTHDHAEAATLFDPETRAILRRALNAMWKAEEQLRIADPDAALPPENEALEAIKQVQQATRIYLARVGSDLPEIDPERRLSGERDALSDRRADLVAGSAEHPEIVAAWAALDAGQAPDAAAVGTWLDGHEDEVVDPLSLRAALDDVANRPDCDDCRQRLRNQLWPLLPLPAAGVVPREPPASTGTPLGEPAPEAPASEASP